ncbi:MAG: phage terminase large subunit [Rhodopila sp.]|nr:phage terminase large subunit [Rhodopila sp.]
MLTLRDLKRLDAVSLSKMPNDLLLELCRFDQGLPVIPTPVYRDQEERDEVATRCRGSFLAWCIEALRHEGLAPAAHHRLLIEHLQSVADRKISKLMIFMPPGSAKSKYTSELFPAWLISRCPGEPVIAASNNVKLAMRFSARVQRYIRAFSEVLGYGLSTEAKERWEATNGSEYLAVGVRGSLPGYRAGVAIIDDPYSGRDDADSENSREKVWEWWDGDLLPRLKPDAGVILMHTRYHENDQAGRLLDIERDQWTVLKLPAVADDENDPLGRAIGEPLWADDAYGFGALLLRRKAELEKRGATREWQSQYQQNPRPAEGALFKVANIQILDVAPNLRGAQIGRGWDEAATRQVGTRDPDWTVGLKLARLQSGLYVVLDVFRDRGGPDEVDNWIHNISVQDRHDHGFCKISIPQDPGAAGKSRVLHLTRLLSGFTVESSPETGDKATRASPAISQVNGGNFAMVKAPWNRVFLDEIAAFPSGTKDDQVDALSRAFSLVGLGPKPLHVSDDVLRALGGHMPLEPYGQPVRSAPQSGFDISDDVLKALGQR